MITTATVAFLQNCGADMRRLVGKEFDGVDDMTGHMSGISARMADFYPTAKYHPNVHIILQLLLSLPVGSCSFASNLSANCDG